MSTTRSRSLWVVLGVALVLRVAWVLYAAREPTNFGDPFIYLNAARHMADGDGYWRWFSTDPTAFHPIGYPGWLAGIVWAAKLVGLDGRVPLVLGLVQALIGTASVALVYAITVRLFGHRAALIAAAITACFPNLVFYTALAYSETLYTFGILLSVWLIVRAEWDPIPKPSVFVWFGIVVGLSALVRPFALVSPLLLGVVVWRAGGFRSAVRTAAITAGIAVLLLVPWAVRNAVEFHAFVPVSTNLGDTLCLDNAPGAFGGYRDVPAECDTPVRNTDDERERNTHNLRVAIRWAAHNPGREAGLVVRRLYYGFRNDHDSLSDLAGAPGIFPPRWLRLPLSRLADLYYYAVVLLALPACIKFGRDPRRLFVLLVAASLAAVTIYLYGLPRFHVPLLPFFAIGAGVTLDALYSRRKAAQA